MVDDTNDDIDQDNPEVSSSLTTPRRQMDENNNDGMTMPFDIVPGDDKFGMPMDEALALWRKMGAPVIHLGPGENCFDLERLLRHKGMSPSHLEAIRDWLAVYHSDTS